MMTGGDTCRLSCLENYVLTYLKATYMPIEIFIFQAGFNLYFTEGYRYFSGECNARQALLYALNFVRSNSCCLMLIK
jgi:hypothetical protein